MKTTRGKRTALSRELASLRVRLAEAEETLRAIRSGEVDAVVVTGRHGKQVFTLEGADHGYRVLIESMNEGALTLKAGDVILYANRCFARMVKCPLEHVMGDSFRRFLSAKDQKTFRLLLKKADKPGSKIQVILNAGDGSQIPVQISARPLAKKGADRATIGMVVTDLTAARRDEEMLRAFSHRLVQVQEAERGRVALDLHGNITQHLCAVVFRSQALVDKLSARDGPSKKEALKLREMLGATVREVERISGDLRSSVLDQLGLVAALQKTGEDFADRTGVSVKLACVKLAARLPIDTELALFRLLQEALKNVEKHAHASHISVSLKDRGEFVHLVIHDDGIGFDPNHYAAGRKGGGGLGLLGMHERAACVGGSLRIKSDRRAGTEIDVRVPQ